MKIDGIKIKGHVGNWYVIDETVKRNYSDMFTHRFGIGAFAMPVETED